MALPKTKKETVSNVKDSNIYNPNKFEPVVVNGCLIESETIYEVLPKEPTSDSPEVYKRLGSTKERVPGISNTIQLAQDNTGFSEHSKFFSLDKTLKDRWDLRKKKSDELYKIFAEPLKNIVGDIERIRIQSDNDFFDRFYNVRNGILSVNIYEGKKFNTANPLERFQLYIAIVEGHLSMKGKREEDEIENGLKNENDPSFLEAQYSYVSLKKSISREEEKAAIKLNASFGFNELLVKNKETLVSVLDYIGIRVSNDLTTKAFQLLYLRYFDDDIDKQRLLLSTLEKLEKNPQTFKIELDILNLLKSKKGRENITRDGKSSTYYMGDIPLGSNPKSIAAKLMSDQSLLNNFYSIFE